MVFLELTTDAFADTFNKRVSDSQRVHRAGTDRARRPLRGLEIKDDTYAILKVIQADGSEVKLLDSGSEDGGSTNYTNFILQSVSEARMEKHQIVETFGEPYIYFFGESPRFLDVRAILVDSFDFNWYAEFWENYNRYLRGTKSVEMGARTYLFYDDNIVEGYMLMAQAQKTSDQPLMAQLSFRLYLTNYSNVTFVGDPNYPVRSSVNLPPDVNLTTADAFTAGQAAISAAGVAAVNDADSFRALVGAQQQESGFGGGQALSDALRSGVTSTGTPNIDGILQNAEEAVRMSGFSTRKSPLRGKISDNLDEFTAQIPPIDDPADLDTSTAEATDLHNTAIQQLTPFGAKVNDPFALQRMGLGPRFGASSGFGLLGAAGFSASFGVRGLGVARAGINGGLGFSGIFTARASIGSASASPFGTPPGSFVPPTPTYGNGVLLQGGVTLGTGVGGGIPRGVSGGISPDGTPLRQFTGGTSFSQPNGFASAAGYGSGNPGIGASLSVGGAPSAFSMTAVPGVYNPVPENTASAQFFIGPDGMSSETNTTGIFA